MSWSRVAPVVLAVLLAGVACGSDDDENDRAVDDYSEICTEAARQIGQLRPDDETPLTEVAPEAAVIVTDAVERLRAVEPPDEQLQSTLDAGTDRFALAIPVLDVVAREDSFDGAITQFQTVLGLLDEAGEILAPAGVTCEPEPAEEGD